MKIITLKLILFCILSLMLINISHAQLTPAVPEFAVIVGGSFRMYSTYTQVDALHWTVEDSFVKATVTNVGTNQWRLDLTAKQTITQTYFPWQSQRISLNGNVVDDIFYYPYIMGLTWKASYINTDFAWWGLRYPGNAALPLVVEADNTNARIVAATNWPPKSLTPLFAAERMVINYDEIIPAGTTASYGALIASVSGNAATGAVPWQLALDQYKSWLDSAMGPVSYPSWMWNGEGFYNIQLENIYTFDINQVDAAWQPVKSLYPWVLMWGQMSSYAGGCCSLDYYMNSLYSSSLPFWVKNTVVANGYHAGYYSAPYYNDPTGYALDTAAGVNWLTKWININKNTYNANSYYIDTLARGYYGDAAKVKALFDNNIIPQESMLEGAVDIYARPALISGSLFGDANGCGAPFKRPEKYNKTSFPNFVRYALGDRLMYQGGSNTDWIYWGNSRGWNSYSLAQSCGIPAYCSANGPCEHGSERLAFLLGAKFDAIQVSGNSIQSQIVEERQRLNWWARRPTYLDTKGLDLTTISPSTKVEITHFKDIRGVDLIAVSNPKVVSGLTFKLNGQTLNVPAKSISVLEHVFNGSSNSSLSNGSKTFDFSLSNEGSKTITKGTAKTLTITATLLTGTSQVVSYSVSGLPAESSAWISPEACSLSCTITMSIGTSATTPTGTYTIVVTGTGSDVTKTTSFTLTVKSSGWFRRITSYILRMI